MIETRPQKTVVPRLRDNLGYHGACQLTGVQRTARPTYGAAVSARSYNSRPK
jgi:hypothetical protein